MLPSTNPTAKWVASSLHHITSHGHSLMLPSTKPTAKWVASSLYLQRITSHGHSPLPSPSPHQRLLPLCFRLQNQLLEEWHLHCIYNTSPHILPSSPTPLLSPTPRALIICFHLQNQLLEEWHLHCIYNTSPHTDNLPSSPVPSPPLPSPSKALTLMLPSTKPTARRVASSLYLQHITSHGQSALLSRPLPSPPLPLQSSYPYASVYKTNC